MPTRAEAYTSLDLVIRPLQGAPEEEPPLAALVRWVRLGGQLLVVGDDAGERALSASTGSEPGWKSGSGSRSPTTCARGRADKGSCSSRDPPSAVFAAPRDAAVVLEILRADKASAPPRTLVTSTPFGHLLEIPGVGELPYEIFLVFLLVFAVVIGPVNFMVLRRIGKPFLLLVTVPAISAAASLLLFLYGAFAQGFGAKAASSSFTLLDQRNASASTIEERAAYVPLAPAPGLRPEAGTSIYPVLSNGSRHFVVDLSEGVLLRNGFLPVRTQFDHVALTDRASHLRLSFAEEEGQLVVHNELSVAVQRLFLRDPEGSTYALREELQPGGAAKLTRAPELDAFVGSSKMIDHDLLGQRPLVASSYVAELAGDPFLDECGVEAELLSESHALYGVLPAREEDW
jgi:hypothetical protein